MTNPGVAGRPRSTESRSSILQACLDLVDEIGYRAVTMDAIAARAGTGKQTIYRWWASKPAVVLEALGLHSRRTVPVPPASGRLRTDLDAFLTAAFSSGRQPHVAPLLAVLLAEAKLDPEFGRLFWDEFQEPRLVALTAVLKRHPDELRVPVPVAIEIVFGVIWYRVLVSGPRFDRTLVEHLLCAVCV